MPQIREYTAENDVLRPTETGIDATAQAARRIGAFYSQAGETEKRSAEDQARAAEARARAAGALATEEKARFGSYGDIAKATGSAFEMAENYAGHQEIGHAAANMAQATQQLTEQWNGTFDAQAKADPNNASIQTGYMQGTFEPWAQKFVSGFNTPLGQDWANEQVDRLRNHLFEKSTADMSTMAGLAVKSNLDKMSTSWENTARSDPSPHNIDFLLKQAEDQINAVVSTSPNLKGVAAARMRTEYLDDVKKGIVRAGALGGIEQSGNPEAAAADYTKRYSDYLNPQETDSVSRAARTYKRAQEVDQDRLEQKQRQATEAASSQHLDGYIKDVWSGGKTTMSDILKDPALTRQDRERAIAVFQKEDNLPPATSHGNTLGILDDIRSGKITTDGQVIDHIRDVNRDDLSYLRNQLAAHKTPEGNQLDYYKRQLADAVKGKIGDSEGIYRWQAELDNKMNGLGRDRMMEVFDPRSPNYMGSADALQPYKTAMQQQIQSSGGVGAPLPATFGDRFQGEPTVTTVKTAPAAGEMRTFEGKTYRFKGGENIKANWEPAAGS